MAWRSAEARRERRREAMDLLTIEREKRPGKITVRDRTYKTYSRAADAIRDLSQKEYEREIRRLRQLAARRRRERRLYREARVEGLSPEQARSERWRRRTRRPAVPEDLTPMAAALYERPRFDLGKQRRLEEWKEWSDPKYGTFPSDIQNLIERINTMYDLAADSPFGHVIAYNVYVMGESLRMALRKRKPDPDGVEDYILEVVTGRSIT